jgi:YVTN family beta-propeller protein
VKGLHYVALEVILLPMMLRAQVSTSSFVNFEGAQTNPIRLSTDRTRLFAVNTPDARLSVFDLSNPSIPQLIAEIPVGIEPVSVNPRTNDEVWVVNQVSDSVSIVSVSQGIVVDTLQVKDEPADVVFAGTYAFVSASRSNEIRVFDVNTHAQVKTIPVFGENPRAMAVSNAGDRVYAAFALSGNRTTNLGSQNIQAQPPPTNPDLPPPPPATLIVDAADPAWHPSVIKYRMPDNDVVEVDVGSLSIRQYYSRVGTINLGIAVRPSGGELYVTNTDANNLTRFEPALRGKFAQNRITKIDPFGAVTPIDLNPGLVTKAAAISQPAAVVFEPSGQFMYVASFGTDRVAIVDLNGGVTGRIEIGPASGNTVDPRRKRGPRGLALNAGANRLYVLNRISNTISVVDTAAKRAIRELNTGSFDPTPLVIRTGRGFLYDTKLSGNGTLSCATCHVDADMDLLDWI